MSSIVESTIINVLNYSDSSAIVSTQIKPDGYLFEPARDEQPFAIPLSFSEIRVANSQSNIFREGILRFDQELESEVYEKLGIRDWEQILTDVQIRKIILNPTKEGLEKLIKITSTSLFERARGMLIMLENSGMYDISMRVRNVINERYRELYMNKRNSDIVITPTASEMSKESATSQPIIDIEALKEEIRKQLLAEILHSQPKVAEEETKQEDDNDSLKQTSANRGRPKNQNAK